MASSNNTHRRRVSSQSSSPIITDLPQSDGARESGVTSAFPAERGGRKEQLDTIAATPPRMSSLSRSPSPQANGGWATPGLSTENSPRKGYVAKGYGILDGNGSWARAQTKSAQVNAYSSQTGSGFFRRNLRQLSASLPRFHLPPSKDYSEKEKLGRGRWQHTLRDLGRIASRLVQRLRPVLFLLLAVLFSLILFYKTRESS